MLDRSYEAPCSRQPQSLTTFRLPAVAAILRYALLTILRRS
jgi:hypothetical protein